jgi:hypothetical protein
MRTAKRCLPYGDEISNNLCDTILSQRAEYFFSRIRHQTASPLYDDMTRRSVLPLLRRTIMSD